MFLYDIIIPVYNQAELTLKCLKTIREFSTGYRIILINNASRDEAWRVIYLELKRHNHILVTNKQNLGFVKTSKGENNG